jgi:hypothetical protein
MGHRVLHAGFLNGFLLFLFGGTCLLFSSGCRSTSYSAPRPTVEPAEIRSELMLLNVPEASGWVAYHCTPSEEPEMEDYRVVVIRQQTGTIIYDSQIPLAVDLCTHGFEMAPDDPRLQHLARTVDSSIIEPLEAFRRNQPAPDPIAAPAEPPLASSDSTSQGSRQFISRGSTIRSQSAPDYRASRNRRANSGFRRRSSGLSGSDFHGRSDRIC